ncbi:MAG: phosphonopyruvate decarboxylase [Lachnospiraceae bacterium]|nr:phosphonopyruvate decarboxylase [Lachnospiraceae bacterium]
MKIQDFVDIIDSEFYTGVPDSLLKELCDYLAAKYGCFSKNHIIAANEGNCMGLAAGYHLATGKIPVVYMQNSGQGNSVNPIASLLNEKVYGIPCVLIVGWRGEPGMHDEPQHVFQGAITLALLETLGIDYCVIDVNVQKEELKRVYKDFSVVLSEGRQVAFVIKKGALEGSAPQDYHNGNHLFREQVLEQIVKYTGNNPIVSTTGKTSRELFEIRERNHEGHGHDFLTVGSMGHSSSIAAEVAMQKPELRVWCVDGDGALLMHMGSMAVIGKCNPRNLVHVVINNESHESVGGIGTAAGNVDLPMIARACGYEIVESVSDNSGLVAALERISKNRKLTFLEVKCQIGSRKDLGRPTRSTLENKQDFMKTLRDCK